MERAFFQIQPGNISINPPNTALLVSLEQMSLKLGGKLIALALSAQKVVQAVGL